MDELHRRRELDSYGYSLGLQPNDGFAGEVTLQIESRGETLGIRAPEGWIVTLLSSDNDSARFSFVAPENEAEARQMYFSTPEGDVAHVRVPPREPQRIALDILNENLSPQEILPLLKQWYGGDYQFANYDPFIKDCTYMMEFEEYIKVIDALAESDPRFRGRYVESHDKWFPNMMLKRRTKYPIRDRETLEHRLELYNQYDSLLDLSLEDVLERYIFKHPCMDKPRTDPEDFDVCADDWSQAKKPS